jgi:hypothetical protein
MRSGVFDFTMLPPEAHTGYSHSQTNLGTILCQYVGMPINKTLCNKILHKFFFKKKTVG